MTGRLQALCEVSALPEGASRGFNISTPAGDEAVFLVHRHGCIVAYRNSCPHTGAPLDWVPDRFLNLDGDLIQCATHDALFRIEDGVCVAGPCPGKRLFPTDIVIENGVVYADAGGMPRDT
jgi:nitrite reductase/ring-hydroxylating ferredoxin subunit